MWKLHTFVNQTYRDLIYGNLKGQQHVVTRRKVEKLYNNYLKTALLFYKGYFQRLEALHGMPQIPRINRLLELNPPDVDESKSASIPVDAVEKSFHSTLLHLGDISRWRNKARPRPDGLKTAVLYYELANDLKPTQGAAHHQLGILEDDNHLNIVYHLYRARAIETPHPNAIPNLEQEFKKLLQPPKSAKRAGPLDPKEAFASWFTKLHARMYNGDQVSPELEEEVMHRFEIALKKPGELPVLLKMVLINVAAYWVAKSKIETKWSLKASASCQFILRLNVRWILSICRLLQSELEEFVKVAPPLEDEKSQVKEGEDAKDHQTSSAFTETVLPLARIYMAWLNIYRSDIVDYEEHLGTYVLDMHRALAQTLTTVAREFSNKAMAASPYLLAEDAVALGMKPFDDSKLPAMCRLQHESTKGNIKPHWEDSGLPKNSPEQEMMSRVHDLVGCGLSLAFDERFPLRIQTPVPGGSGSVTVSYVEGGKLPVPVQDPTGDLRTTSQDIEQLQGQVHDLNSSPGLGNQHANGDDDVGGQPSTGRGSTDVGLARAASGYRAVNGNKLDTSHPPANHAEETESDLSLHARMEHMVDNLLDDDNLDLGAPSPPGFVRTPREPSYGMHSATAEQVFGAIQAEGNGVGGAFDQGRTSWDAFADASRFGTHQRGAPTTSQQGLTAGINARISPLHPSVPAFPSSSRPQSGAGDQPILSLGNPTPFGNALGQNGRGFGRPSSGLSGPARGSPGHSRRKLGASTDSNGASPFLSPNGETLAYRAAAGSKNVEDIVKTPPPGLGWGNSSFSTAFSHNASGLPTVNSPYGLPGANLDGAFGQRDPFSNYESYTAQPNKWVQYQRPNNTNTVCNGVTYNAVKDTSVATALTNVQPKPKR